MENKEMLDMEQQMRGGAPCEIYVQNKRYKIRQICNTVRTKIYDLELEAYNIEKQTKDGQTLRNAKRASRKLRTLHSKTAAYYLLNKWALFVPLLWSITWRLLDLRDSEHTFEINNAGVNNVGYAFFLRNWQITKAQLALSMNMVSQGVEQWQKRMESAEQMLGEDLPTSQDSK